MIRLVKQEEKNKRLNSILNPVTDTQTVLGADCTFWMHNKQTTIEK